MTSTNKKYLIYYIIDKKAERLSSPSLHNIKLSSDDIEVKEELKYYDYNSNSTLNSLKEYFLSFFGQRYDCCNCMLSLYKKTSTILGSDTYQSILNSDDTKLKQLHEDKFYLKKKNDICTCNYNIKKYWYMEKSKIIETLIDFEIKFKKLEKKYYDIKSENEELIKFYKHCMKENNELKKIKEINHFKFNSKFEDFYDIIININSIKTVNKEGWEVKFNEKGIEKYDKYKENELITLGVIGNNNKGKSFILSKLSKIELLTGTSIHTEGLSVKYPELKDHKGRQLILLDSAGFETPVLKKNLEDVDINKSLNKEYIGHYEENEKNKEEYEQNNKFKENARDKIMTELFLENFIINVSDILLLVVGKLTYSEQLLINKIKEESKKHNKKSIYIIHNLQEFSIVEQVKNYIENTLLQCSTLDLKKRPWITTQKDKESNTKDKTKNKKGINGNSNLKIMEENKQKNNNNNKEIDINKINEELQCHYTETLKYGDDKSLDIFHLIIANENSEAGKVYNQYAFQFIESNYNIISQPKKFDVFERIKENFKQLSNKILIDNIENASFNETKNIRDSHKMILNFEPSLHLKKCFTNELGFSFFKTGRFEPKYNYFQPSPNTFEIRLEAPGNTDIKINHKIIGDEVILNVRGNKKKDNNPKEIKDNIINCREFGEFELNIPLKTEKYNIRHRKKGYPKREHGIYCVQYDLASDSEDEGGEVINSL